MMTTLATYAAIAILTLLVYRVLCALCHWAVTVPCGVCHWWLRGHSSTLQCPICMEFVHSAYHEPDLFSLPKSGGVTSRPRS